MLHSYFVMCSWNFKKFPINHSTVDWFVNCSWPWPQYRPISKSIKLLLLLEHRHNISIHTHKVDRSESVLWFLYWQRTAVTQGSRLTPALFANTITCKRCQSLYLLVFDQGMKLLLLLLCMRTVCLLRELLCCLETGSDGHTYKVS